MQNCTILRYFYHTEFAKYRARHKSGVCSYSCSDTAGWKSTINVYRRLTDLWRLADLEGEDGECSEEESDDAEAEDDLGFVVEFAAAFA